MYYQLRRVFLQLNLSGIEILNMEMMEYIPAILQLNLSGIEI